MFLRIIESSSDWVRKGNLTISNMLEYQISQRLLPSIDWTIFMSYGVTSTQNASRKYILIGYYSIVFTKFIPQL